MSQLVEKSPATLYVNGTAIGCCDLELPEPEPLETIPTYWDRLQVSFRLLGSKKTRKLRRSLDGLAMSKADRAVVQHYRRVKHHQLRKRWLKSK
jgi:hypothetical protein